VLDVAAACSFVADRLAVAADPAKARDMARYMKTDMPFYGVQRAGRAPILKEVTRRWAPRTRQEYSSLVEGLWNRPHREEKYLAIGVARAHGRFVTRTALPLYRRLIVQGAWWDLVDETAIKLVGRVLRDDRTRVTPTVRGWIRHRDLWVRRTSVICQVGHKDATDESLLFDACSDLAHETDFFIRKAIGWALRDYAKTSPDSVRAFVSDREADLSRLSVREATKHL